MEWFSSHLKFIDYILHTINAQMSSFWENELTFERASGNHINLDQNQVPNNEKTTIGSPIEASDITSCPPHKPNRGWHIPSHVDIILFT